MQSELKLNQRGTSQQKTLEQYQTPLWAAEGLGELFLTEVEKRTSNGLILEPSCGEGRFLEALPKGQPAYGIEIDPSLADIARTQTQREIFCEDFLLTTIPEQAAYRPAHILGNPPFKIEIVRGFLRRAHALLPEGGCCGLLLPAHSFQHTHTLMDWIQNWHIRPWLLPRDIFHGLSTPILFALFQKENGEKSLEGFALYGATHRIKGLPKHLKNTLETGAGQPPGPKSTWKMTVALALESLGGQGKLSAIYERVEPLRPTDNIHWREKVRQILKMHFTKTGEAWATA